MAMGKWVGLLLLRELANADLALGDLSAGSIPLHPGPAAEVASEPCHPEDPCDACRLLSPGELVTETTNLCGHNVEYLKYCPQSGPPPITPAMATEQSTHPDLQQGTQVHFGCVNQNEGDGCQASESKETSPELDQALSALEAHGNAPEVQAQFHQLVTQSTAPKELRDDAAMTTQTGYSREITGLHLLYKVNDHELFHENAEGVALAYATTVDKEKAAQLRLADTLAQLKGKFQSQRDSASEKSASLYEKLARSRAELLDAFACDLKQKAAVNRERQNNLSSIAANGLAIEGIDASGVSGMILEKTSSVTATKAESAGVSLKEAANGKAEILTSFAAYASPAAAPAPEPSQSDPEMDLFHRVHGKYLEIEGRGFFYRTLLD